MSQNIQSNNEFETEIEVIKDEHGYTVKLMRNDRTAPIASIFVDTEKLSDMASTLGGSQDKALDFIAGLLVRTFCEDRKSA